MPEGAVVEGVAGTELFFNKVPSVRTAAATRRVERTFAFVDLSGFTASAKHAVISI